MAYAMAYFVRHETKMYLLIAVKFVYIDLTLCELFSYSITYIFYVWYKMNKYEIQMSFPHTWIGNAIATWERYYKLLLYLTAQLVVKPSGFF